MQRDDREGRDAAGIGPYAREREGLVTLSSLGSWNVSDGEPDIRGWEVQTVSGRKLGTVAELLIDPKAGEVVMLDVDLPGTDQHSFVPIRVVQIDRTRRLVLMDSADLPEASQLRQVPADTVQVTPVEPARVRYPRADREVTVGRIGGPSDTVASDPVPTDPMTDTERRRQERRHIERMSTDL
jgi:sporulation protein YlmC with PRC-barrel domain